MSAVGSCYDNAAAESFFGVLKRERVNRRHYVTGAEARADVFEYIELFYNPRKRRMLENADQTVLNRVSGKSVENQFKVRPNMMLSLSSL